MTDQIAALLVELALKSSLALAVAFAVAALARRRSSEERHVIWVFALVGLLVLPVGATVGPTVEVPVQAIVATAKSAANSANVDPGSRTSTHGIANTSAMTAATTENGVPSTLDDHAAGSLGMSTGFWPVEAAVLVTAVYGTVALSLFAWFGLASLGVALSLGKLAPVTDASVLKLLKETRLRRGIRRDVRLVVSQSDCTPWAWGVLRPVIVLPYGFTRLPAESRRNAIEHEISHIARLDFLSAMLGCVCCALYWFQPLAWLALRRMTRESERACDDRVLLTGSCHASYAAQLLDLAKTIHRKGTRPILSTAMAGRSAISQRIASILDLNIRRRTVSKMKALCTLILTLAMVVPLAALKSQAAATPGTNDLADTEFQALVQKGPANSDELALIIETFAAHDRQADSVDVLADYISRDSKNTDAKPADLACRFCGSILKTEAFGSERSGLLPTLLSAFDEVERRARAANDGDLLLRLAAISGATESNLPMRRGTYYLLEGFRIGNLSDQSKLAAVRFLNDLGWYPQAMKLAEQLHNDETSSLYQSEATQIWMERLNSRVELPNAIYTRLVTPGFTTVTNNDDDIVPLYTHAPVYPPAALAQHKEADVVLEFTITEFGRPRNVKVVRSSDSTFNDAAVDALSKFLYAPRLVDGVPVEINEVQTMIRFKLM